MLIAWENEALLSVNKLNPGEFEIVYPSQTILAEPPVAVVDANVDKHGTREVAAAYLKYLYSPEGQDVDRPQLLPSPRQGRAGEIREPVPGDQALHRGRTLRRLGQSPEGISSATAASSTRFTRRRGRPDGCRGGAL